MFFRSLANIGIDREYLQNITDDNIIRIEKKLVAERKLNNSLSKNDTEIILRLLKEYRVEIGTICKYECFYSILTGGYAEHIDTIRFRDDEEKERIRTLVSSYFVEDIIEYINLNINSNNWNDLRVLIHYKELLSLNILSELAEKLEGKFKYGFSIFKTPPEQERFLTEKVGYFTNPDFFMLLGEVDRRHFYNQLLNLLRFIKENQAKTKGISFYHELLLASSSFDVNDLGLKRTARMLAFNNGGYPLVRNPYVYMGFALLVPVLIAIAIIWSSSATRNIEHPRVNFWKDQSDSPLGGVAYRKEQQNLDMEGFVEARQMPVYDPPNSSSVPTAYNSSKYGAPFLLPIFRTDVASIKHPGMRHINLFNNSNKDCIVIAYFNDEYDYYAKQYKTIRSRDTKDIYAVYLPKKDSIQLDLGMYLLRFYMGNRLKNFNTYKGYMYADSTDAKFSRYDKADSALFSRAFTFYGHKTFKNKKLNLIISQPSAAGYKLDWSDEHPIYQWLEFAKIVENVKPDSIALNKPLLIKTWQKPDIEDAIEKHKQEVNSFLEQ